MAILRDLTKENGSRATKQSRFHTYVVCALHRYAGFDSSASIMHEQWQNVENYAVVTAAHRRDALTQFLKSRPDLIQKSQAWSFDEQGQRVWSAFDLYEGQDVRGILRNCVDSMKIDGTDQYVRYVRS